MEDRRGRPRLLVAGRHRPPADDHYLLVGWRPDVPFELEVLDAAGRRLAVRSPSVAAHEWQRLEIPLAR